MMLRRTYRAAFLSCWLIAAFAQASTMDPAPFAAHQPLASRPAGRPATIFLWYSDGLVQPEDGPYCTGLKPPAWQCSFGATLDDCRRQVQSYLDRWYAQFNVIFTLSRPRTSDFYTIIITSNGGWCAINSTEAGVAPFNCNDTPGQTAFAFECGKSAHDCAAIIAHEHAHMVGLEHTTSATDLLFPAILANADGFQDVEYRTSDALCTPKQNSFQMMLKQLGPWPGGDKPSPFSASQDAGVMTTPDADVPFEVHRSGTGGGTGPFLPIGDAGTSLLAGYDALPPPQPTDNHDLPAMPPARQSGCQFTSAPTHLGLFGIGWLLLALHQRARRPR